LSKTDHKYLKTLFQVYNSGPVGEKAIASSCAEDVSTITDYVESYLLGLKFIARTPRGRVLTPLGMQYVVDNIINIEKGE